MLKEHKESSPYKVRVTQVTGKECKPIEFKVMVKGKDSFFPRRWIVGERISNEKYVVLVQKP